MNWILGYFVVGAIASLVWSVAVEEEKPDWAVGVFYLWPFFGLIIIPNVIWVVGGRIREKLTSASERSE